MPAKGIKEITRRIDPAAERELWVRAGGRCQFRGHNMVLYRSPLTQRAMNIAEKAHIYSFSEKGPRGWGPWTWKKAGLNEVGNLMLMCPACHKEIDDDNGASFPAELLQRWKREHEERVEMVTGVAPSNKSAVVIYAEKIGVTGSVIHPHDANWAIFPGRYPATEWPVTLNMTWAGRDTDPDYWRTAETNLKREFANQVGRLVVDGSHFSIFGFAPMPLLTLLGSLFTDKVQAQTYQRVPETESHQLRREPEPSWNWLDSGPDLGFRLVPPARPGLRPALVFSISAKVKHERVHAVLGASVAVWEITISNPHNDCLVSKTQLSEFRKVCRKAMVEIAAAHGNATPLAIFSAMPVSAAVDFGRIRMPKADMPWELYDHNNVAGKFIHALTIGA